MIHRVIQVEVSKSRSIMESKPMYNHVYNVLLRYLERVRYLALPTAITLMSLILVTVAPAVLGKPPGTALPA